MFLARHKGTDKFGDHTVKQVPLQLVAVFDPVHEAQPPQLNIAANGGEHVILYGRRGTYLEMLDVTPLFDRSVVLFNWPMQVVQPKKPVTVEGGQSLAVGEVDGISGFG